MDYSNINEYESRNSNNNKNEAKDGDTDELGNSQHLDDLMSDKIVDHEDPVILTKGSFNSTSVSVNESTNIDILYQVCFYSVYTNYKAYLYSIYTKP